MIQLTIFRQILKEGWRGFKLHFLSSRHDKYGKFGQHTVVLLPFIGNKANIFLDDHVSIGENATFICSVGHFYVKKYTSIAKGVTVICQNHKFFAPGDYPNREDWGRNQTCEDVIVEDGCWIGANVTLCPGVTIPRGCLVAAGSVCVKSKKYLPYTVIGGNPAVVLKHRFTLEQQIEHEKLLYSNEERYSNEKLEEYYEEANTILNIDKHLR